MTAAEKLPVEIAARPGPFELDTAHSAVIVVDMQHDFAADEGMFGRAGLPLSGIRSVIEPTSRVLDAARREGMLVVYLAMQFAPDLADLGPEWAPNRIRHLALGVGQPVAAPDGSSSRVLVAGTWNTAIVAELRPQPGDLIVPKRRFSGFFETDLDRLLREREVISLVFTGCTTSVCVESTLRDAFYRDYACLLLTDCCAEVIGSEVDRTNHDATITVIERAFGWTTASDRFLGAFSEAATPAPA